MRRVRVLAVVVAAVFFIVLPTFGKTWTGAVSGLWSDPRNWSPEAIPAPGEALVFPQSAAYTTMTNDLPPGTSVGALAILPDLTLLGPSLTLNGNALTLMGDLTFNAGTFFVCNADLRLGTSVRSIGQSAYAFYNGAVDVNGQTLTVDSLQTRVGALNGSGSVVVNGSLKIGGGNFAGPIAGRIALAGSLPNANLTAGALMGRGTIGEVTISQTGLFPSKLAPGDGEFCCYDDYTKGLLQTKSLTIGSAGYAVDLFGDGTSDSVHVTGNVTLNGPLALSVPTGALTAGQSFTIIDNDGTDAVSGTFTALPEGAIIAVGTSTLQISYHGGDGNDVVLTVASARKIWTGAVSELWSDPRNWSPQTVPAPGEALVFPQSATYTTMINDLPPGTTVGAMAFLPTSTVLGPSLTLNGNALTLTGDLSVDGFFVCNADLRLGTSVRFDQSGYAFYNGAVDINGQTLTVDSLETRVGALNGSGSVVVNGSLKIGGGNFAGPIAGIIGLAGSLPNANLTAGALTGRGTIGEVTISQTGPYRSTLAPGYGEYCCYDDHTKGLLQTKSLTIGSAGYAVDLFGDGTSDSVHVTGTVTLNAPLMVSAGTLTVGQSFTIIDNDGTDAVNGTFTGLPEGATLHSGAATLRISYRGGDGNDVVLVATGPTAATLTESKAATEYGQPFTLTATVTSTFGVPTGSVELFDGGTSLGSAALTGGTAVLTLAHPAAGTHGFTAVYAGSGPFLGSASAAVSLTVARAPTTVSVPFGGPIAAGDNVLFPVSVAGAGLPADGTVTVSEGGHVLLASQPLTAGSATVTLTHLAPGQHTLAVAYLGSANFEPSSVTVGRTVLLQLIIGDALRVPEGNDGVHTVSMTLRLSAPSLDPVQLSYATADGTATANHDYLPAIGTITFAPGQTMQQIDLQIVGNVVPEQDKTFSVVLSGASNATLATPSVDVVIANDDPFYDAMYDLEYANVGGQSLTLDLYIPTSGGPFPLVVWVPGDLTLDSALNRLPPALHETQRGYAVAALTYRSEATAPFPAQLADVEAAMRWLRANAARFHLDPQRFGAWGVGAGAQLAALLGTMDDDAQIASIGGGNPSFSCRAQAIVDSAGPTGIVLPYVTSHAAPFLIMHGANDDVFAPAESQTLKDALQSAGADASLWMIPGAVHDPALWSSTDVLAKVDSFFDRALKAHGRGRPSTRR